MADHQNRFFHRKKIMTIFFVCAAVLCGLLGRLLYLMVWRAEYYEEAATRLHERERSIKAARGRILDRNGVVLADNKMVCTVSVIHNQIEEPEQVIAILVKELGISEEEARKRVEKYSSIERVKSNVDKTVGDRIREYDLAGVKVDEDYKRYYPYGDLASKVLGFTGGDNQGIIGLEVVYEEILQGDPGMILTITDAKGIEVDTAGERRVEPVPGMDLRISIDRNIQEYATQLAAQACATKEADSVYIVAMNPQNGEILAMVNYPEFDLNDPYTLPELTEVKEDGSIVAVDPATLTAEQKQAIDLLLISGGDESKVSDYSNDNAYRRSQMDQTDQARYDAAAELYGIDARRYEALARLAKEKKSGEETSLEKKQQVLQSLMKRGMSRREAYGFYAVANVSNPGETDWSSNEAACYAGLSDSGKTKYQTVSEYFISLPPSDFAYIQDVLSSVSGTRNASGKTVTGSKKKNQIAALMGLGMSQEEATIYYNLTN